MITSLVVTLLALVPAAPQARAAGAPALEIGMAAPALAVESWIQGTPIERFEPGKLYVIEFWATWCGPCIASMPHLSALQREYGDDGLTIIGLTSADDRNTLDQVKALVASKGELLSYTVAWDQGHGTYEAYMTAAGRRGIPCSFVVDQAGRVAYIGHPLFLEEPLAELLAGTWDLAQDPERLEQDSQTFFGFYASARTDPEGTLAKLSGFEAVHPRLAALIDPLRLDVALAAEDRTAVQAAAARLLERGKATRDVEALLQVASAFARAGTKLTPTDLDVALRAAQAANELTGGRDASTLAALAAVHAARGDYAQAAAIQTQAIQAAPDKKRAPLLKTLEEYQAKARQTSWAPGASRVSQAPRAP